ncbi:hypothetical protein Cci01nite_16280 [Catellatospora citrea]|uniref:Uncharacterized protein n=1 Tax=Catellatospora citrea TaxID=53366 RepID=A0A8J3KJZ3_9ACTN|nr:hypothetical protein Cci01nite_16280 [Catellatospora citrea]
MIGGPHASAARPPTDEFQSEGCFTRQSGGGGQVILATTPVVIGGGTAQLGRPPVVICRDGQRAEFGVDNLRGAPELFAAIASRGGKAPSDGDRKGR